MNPVDQWFNKVGKNPALGLTVSILGLMVIVWVAFGWNLGNIGLATSPDIYPKDLPALPLAIF